MAKYDVVKSKSLWYSYRKRLFTAIIFQIILLICISGQACAQIEGDFDDNLNVDVFDLAHLVSRWLSPCGAPNWCDGADIDQSQIVDLPDFARLAKNWGPSNLEVVNNNHYPTRVTNGPNGNIYVTDSTSNSVFIYHPDIIDPNNASPIGELKGLDRPLGIAVSSDGRIFVGNQGKGNVEIYNNRGKKIGSIGNRNIKVPTDLAFDQQGNLYVVDSANGTVRVYDPQGEWLRNIGESGDGITNGFLGFPSCLLVDEDGASGLYVGDQATGKIQVFDFQGNFIRSFGGKPKQSFMSGTWKWEGKFMRIQSIAMDANGWIHALDCYMNRVQIINPVTGSYIDSYGDAGTGIGQLKLPLGMTINASGHVIIANAENKRVEVIYTIP